jgi:hypothetical protein
MHVMVGADDSVIDALLAVRSAEEIALVVRERRLNRRDLKDALRRRREASAVGSAADAALLDFLDEEIDRLLPSALDVAGSVTTLEQVMELAIEATSLLEVLGLLRKYDHLLPGAPVSHGRGLGGH